MTGSLTLLAELDGNGDVTARFVYADKGHVPSYVRKNNRDYRIVTDHLARISHPRADFFTY